MVLPYGGKIRIILYIHMEEAEAYGGLDPPCCYHTVCYQCFSGRCHTSVTIRTPLIDNMARIACETHNCETRAIFSKNISNDTSKYRPWPRVSVSAPTDYDGDRDGGSCVARARYMVNSCDWISSVIVRSSH